MSPLAHRPQRGATSKRSLRPTTRAGRIAWRLALAFAVLWFANSALAGIVGTRTVAVEGAARVALIGFGLGVLTLGASAGVVGGYAILRRHDRSVLVYATLAPLAFVLIFLLGELLLPH